MSHPADPATADYILSPFIKAPDGYWIEILSAKRLGGGMAKA